MPNVSVIIPTFNRAHLIEESVLSVLAQTSKPKEVIVVDDGSSDKTWNVLKNLGFSISESQKKFLRYIYKKNGGVSSARNVGIELSSSEYIALLDSDDQWKPTKLEVQFSSLKKESFSFRVSHTNEIWIRNGIRVNQHKKHRKNGGDLFEKCLKMCCISPSSALIHRSVFNDLGNFDESLKACEDYDFWLRYCAFEQTHFVNERLTIKNGGHSDQLSQLYWGMDRFRIYSLEKLLKNKKLSRSKYELALTELILKLKILMNGSMKRGKKDFAYALNKKIIHFEGLLGNE
jgi:glycosyltransferase involved in cell wall biosynthesis